MNKEFNGKQFNNIGAVGNFTKHAVENFEENIVNHKDYLEKVKEPVETTSNVKED